MIKLTSSKISGNRLGKDMVTRREMATEIGLEHLFYSLLLPSHQCEVRMAGRDSPKAYLAQQLNAFFPCQT